jgi:hypothetical protein
MNRNDKFNIEIGNLNYKPVGTSFLNEHIWSRQNPAFGPMHVLVVGYLADMQGHPILQTGYGAYVNDNQHSETMSLSFGDMKILQVEFFEDPNLAVDTTGAHVMALNDILALFDEFALSHKNVMYANDTREFTAQTITFPVRHLLRTFLQAAEKQEAKNCVSVYREINRTIFEVSVLPQEGGLAVRFQLVAPPTDREAPEQEAPEQEPKPIETETE